MKNKVVISFITLLSCLSIVCVILDFPHKYDYFDVTQRAYSISDFILRVPLGVFDMIEKVVSYKTYVELDVIDNDEEVVVFRSYFEYDGIQTYVDVIHVRDNLKRIKKTQLYCPDGVVTYVDHKSVSNSVISCREYYFYNRSNDYIHHDNDENMLGISGITYEEYFDEYADNVSSENWKSGYLI